MITINPFFIISPLSGAVIGYFTNWVAIKMLFRPHTEKYIFGRRLPFTPGLIPKRRYVLAEKVAKTISIHLLTDETLVMHLCGDEVRCQAEAVLERLLGDASVSRAVISGLFLENESDKRAAKISDLALKLIGSAFFEQNVKPLMLEIIGRNINGLASLFVTPESVYKKLRVNIEEYVKDPANLASTEEKLISFYSALIDSEGNNVDNIKSVIMSKYDNAIKSIMPPILETIDLSGVIEAKINDFEMGEAEDIITSVVDRELKAITYLGGLLGFIIGLVPPVLQLLGIN